MVGHGLRVGVGLDRDQFQVGSIGEAGLRHLSGVVAVRTSILRLNADRGQAGAHLLRDPFRRR